MAAADIVDDNLRLALVESLINKGMLPKFDRRKFVIDNDLPRGEGEDGPDYEDEDENPDYHAVREIQSELTSWLLPSHLPLIEELYWEGGMQTQHWIWTFWDGESDEFNIESLEGIERCTSLRKLSIRYNSSIQDLSPLASLSTLETVSLSGGFDDVSALAALPGLVELDLSYVKRVSDVSALRGHGALESIDLKATSVRDLSFALDVPRLKKLATSKETALSNAIVVQALTGRGVAVSS